jgi:hypothetical protein
MKKEVLFEETQGGGNQSKIVFFKMPAAFFTISLIIHFLMHPENKNLAIALFTGLVLCIIIIVFLNYRLITEIRTDGIYVRFPPFSPSYEGFLWNEIERVYMREFDPISEYNGWGIKTGLSGRSFTMSGTTGIQIILKDKRSVLIGTNQPEAIKEVLHKLRVL